MCKRILALLVLLFVSTSMTYATDVEVAASVVPFANITGLPSEATGLANVTNGSTSVTITSGFRSQWVNQSGFIINFPAGDYYVSMVATGGVVTLAMPYGGPTAAGVTYRVYPYILLRLYASMPYTPLGKSYIVQAGTPGSSQWYKQTAASVRQNQVYLPVMILDATTDAVNPAERAARLSAYFYRVDGSQISVYGCFASFQLRPGTPTSWTAICSQNQAGTISPPDTSYYLTSQIDSFLPVCNAGQMAFYQATGRPLTCLTVGAGLTIAGGVITSSGGGGGGGPTVWSALTDPTANLNLNHGSFSTSMQWSANTGGAALFTLSTGANDPGTNAVLTVATPGTTNAKTPLLVSARSLPSLVVGPTGKAGFNQGTPVAQVDVVPDSTTTVGVRVAAPAGSTANLLVLSTGGVLGPRFVANAAGTVDSVMGSGGGPLSPGNLGGYLHIPSISGPPSGNPTIYTGTVPIVYDLSGNKFWVYEGTWFDMTPTGSGGGGGPTAWSSITNPTTNLALSMGANPSSFTWNSATGSSDLFTLTNSPGDTGTGTLLRVQAHGTKQPFLVQNEANTVLRVTSGGKVVIGRAGDSDLLGAPNPMMYLTADSPETAQLVIYQANPSPLTSGKIAFHRASGLFGSPGNVTAGTYLGEISFDGVGSTARGSIAAQTATGGLVDVLIGHLNPNYDWLTLKGSGLVGLRQASPAAQFHITSSAANLITLIAESPSAPTGDIFQWRINGATKGRFAPSATGTVYNYVFGDQALPFTATDGFVYIPTITTNAPAGSPTAYPGMAPIVLRNEAGNTKLYAYLQSNWVDLTGAGGPGGATAWSAITNPTGNLTLSMASFITSMAYGNTTSLSNLWTIATGTNDTGTNYLMTVATPGASNAKSPFRIQARGGDTMIVDSDGDVGFGTTATSGVVTVVRTTTSSVLKPAVDVRGTISGVDLPMPTADIDGLYASMTETRTGVGSVQGFPNAARFETIKNLGTNPALENLANITITQTYNESVTNGSNAKVHGIYFVSPTVGTGKTVDHWYGIYMENFPTGGTITNKYAIYITADAGNVVIGSALTTSAKLSVQSTGPTQAGLRINAPPSSTGDIAHFRINGTNKIRFVPGGSDVNSVFGTAALANAATDGFVYLPITTSDAPGGTPTAFPGTAAVVIENDTASAQYNLWGFVNGNWRNLTGAGGPGGATAWNAITVPTGNLALAHGTNRTTMTWNQNAGLDTLWTFTNTSGNTGHTGYLVSIDTPGASNQTFPFRVQTRGQQMFSVERDGAVLVGGATADAALSVLGVGALYSSFQHTLSVANSGGVIGLSLAKLDYDVTNAVAVWPVLDLIAGPGAAGGATNAAWGHGIRFMFRSQDSSLHERAGLYASQYAGEASAALEMRVKAGTVETIPNMRMKIVSGVNVTDNSPVTLYAFAVALNEVIGGVFDVTVIARNASAVQVYTGVVRYQTHNQSGAAATPTMTVVSGGGTGSSGTLACTFDGTVSSSVNVSLRMTCDTSLTSLTEFRTWSQIRHNSTQNGLF